MESYELDALLNALYGSFVNRQEVTVYQYETVRQLTAEYTKLKGVYECAVKAYEKSKERKIMYRELFLDLADKLGLDSDDIKEMIEQKKSPIGD